MKNNILIIDTSNVNKGVFQSHVFNLAQKIEDNTGILSINSLNDLKKIDPNKYSEINSDLDLGWQIKSNKSIFTLGFYKEVMRFIDDNNIKILYCQNYLPSFLGIIFKFLRKNLQIHADIKGIVPEEHLLYDKGIKKYAIYIAAKWMEFFIFKYADSYSVVSAKFKDYFMEKYKIGNKNIIVLPSSIDHSKFYFDETIRSQVREQHNWKNKKVLIYSGSMVEWQLPEKLLQTMHDISIHNDDIIPLVLTLDGDTANKIKRDLSFHKLIIKSCNGNIEVNKYLNASDIAMTIRRDDIVNNVSSPTKIAEYLYTKNKLILSNGIGDYSDLTKSYGGIYKIDHIDEIDLKAIQTFISQESYDERIIKMIEQNYTLDSNIDKINTLFGNI